MGQENQKTNRNRKVTFSISDNVTTHIINGEESQDNNAKITD